MSTSCKYRKIVMIQRHGETWIRADRWGYIRFAPDVILRVKFKDVVEAVEVQCCLTLKCISYPQVCTSHSRNFYRILRSVKYLNAMVYTTGALITLQREKRFSPPSTAVRNEPSLLV